MEESLIPVALESLHSKIKGRFPLLGHDGLGHPRIYLNTGAGSLMVDTAIEAMSEASQWMNPMPGQICPGEFQTARFHERVRGIVKDFLHAWSETEISFHFSATAALFNLAFAMRSLVGPEDNLIVTDLDHMANVSPWESVLGDQGGCEIRRARVTESGELDTDHLLSLVDRKTRVAAVTLASNGFGTVVPLRELAAAVREKNPEVLICVDAVHHALHRSIDVRDIGCDFLVFSGYKVFGPMLGLLWGKRDILARLKPYRVETNKDEPPFKFEMGMLNNGALGALEAALGYLLWLADEMSGPESPNQDRLSRFRSVFAGIAEYEQKLTRRVLEGLRDFPDDRFRLFGIADPDRAGDRHPTFAFEVFGQNATETKSRLWEEHSIQIADGNHYSAAVVRHLGKTALCRASFAHYDTLETADVFLEALAGVIRGS